MSFYKTKGNADAMLEHLLGTKHDLQSQGSFSEVFLFCK